VGRAISPALQAPVYWMLRAGLTAPLVAGPRPSLEAARALGRRFATLPFNEKRLQRAAGHIELARPDLDRDQRRALAVRAYEHLFMLGVEIAFAPRLMSEDAWIRHIELDNIARGMRAIVGDRPAIMITGHCGNWELTAYTLALLGFPMHAVYRPLDNKALDRWVRATRGRRGLVLLDKFGAVRAIPPLLAARSPIGFVADQNAGDRGLFVPFFGRLASTYKSIGMAAFQHDAVVLVGQARRLGWNGAGEIAVREGFASPATGDGIRYRVEIEDVFGPEDWRDQPDPLYYIAARYRRALERLILRAPEQYLWMHRIWKSRPPHERRNRPFPDTLRTRLEALPWMRPEEVRAVMDRSDADRAFLAERGIDRLP
jgi:Kdo2-lipid IVA lauroyltransferase/acyltransferase